MKESSFCLLGEITFVRICVIRGQNDPCPTNYTNIHELEYS